MYSYTLVVTNYCTEHFIG